MIDENSHFTRVKPAATAHTIQKGRVAHLPPFGSSIYAETNASAHTTMRSI